MGLLDASSLHVLSDTSWQTHVLLAFASLLVGFLVTVSRKTDDSKKAKDVVQEEQVAGEERPLSSQDAEECLRRLGAPRHVHEEGSFLPSTGLIVGNSPDASAFENELCSGKFFSMHRATHDRELDKSGDYPYGDYFKHKSRLWEARAQLKFKVPPTVEDLYFGVEIPEYVPMNAASKSTLSMAVRALRGVVGHQTYHTVGDDPKRTDGEVELPVFMMPLWAFDQIIVTPEGVTPPALNDPGIPDMGSKRYQRIREYRDEVASMEFKVGPTYTFCFWGISRFLDKLNWQLRLPLSPMPVSLNTLCGRPPVIVVMYTLKKSEANETRHLQSRKNYYLRVAFWSSQHRPDPEHLDSMLNLSQMQALASTAVRGQPLEHWHTKRGDLRKKRLQSWISCCAPFISTHS